MRLRKNAKTELLKGVPLFSQCSRDELAAIADETTELALPPARRLASEGERGREFIVIAGGTAEVSQEGTVIAQLGPGDFLGEIALISGQPRTATVTTTSAATVMVLTDRAFERITDSMPAVREKVMKALAERLHASAF